MSTVTFDTHQFVKKLTAAGASDQLAEALVEAQKEAIGEALGAKELATKRDLKELEIKLELKIAESKADIIRWMVGALLAQSGIIAALVKLL
ncbi:coiled-coil domain-containing protein [Chitinimonas koreensis]|uniref:coiled-coil domain-containing protein n=1 Tax=Chitinimonas koreensis TaxID=356302 RepID=UPI0003F63059|nr:coiled-coil domain-containing protein [Chitinimonas koreensis]QNM98678.1 DUF1640 domain-containing protein [Chitinimonas koreensis]